MFITWTPSYLLIENKRDTRCVFQRCDGDRTPHASTVLNPVASGHRLPSFRPKPAYSHYRAAREKSDLIANSYFLGHIEILLSRMHPQSLAAHLANLVNPTMALGIAVSSRAEVNTIAAGPIARLPMMRESPSAAINPASAPNDRSDHQGNSKAFVRVRRRPCQFRDFNSSR